MYWSAGLQAITRLISCGMHPCTATSELLVAHPAEWSVVARGIAIQLLLQQLYLSTQNDVVVHICEADHQHL